MINYKIHSKKVLSEYKKLCQKIVKEHYQITLPFDRSFNYLWWMYHMGTKQGELADFIILSEANLLVETGELHQEGFENLTQMLSSEDEGNILMAILSIKTLRNERIKKHGEFTDIETASPLMVQIARDTYGAKVMTMKPKKVKDDN